MWTRTWFHIGSLALLYLVVATAYNMLNPLYEAPDERSHVGYVEALRQDWSIPELAPDTYVAVGPPFYHAVGAAVIEVIGLSPPFLDIPFNQTFPNPRNTFWHTPAENDLPYRGPVLSIHVLRGISTLFGAGTVVMIYLIAAALFPGRRLLAWSAGATTALLPQFAFIGAAVMNDTTAAFFSATSLYAGIRVMQGGLWKWIALGAICLALGFLTESSTIIPAVLCALAVLMSPHPILWRFAAISVLALVPLAIAGWFHIGHLVEYGEIYPTEAVRDVIPQLGPGLPLDHEAYRGPFQSSLSRSYWYVGGVVIYLPSAVYQLLHAVAAMAAAGLITWGVRSKTTLLQKKGLTLLFLMIVLAIVEVVWVSVTVSFQPQGRYLFIAQPGFAIFLALGLIALFQRDTERDNAAAFVLPAILLAINIGILTLTLPSVY